MAALRTDDAVRFGPDTPADVGKQAIRVRNQRSAARPIKVLTFVPEMKGLTIWNGGAVEWRYFTASVVASSGGGPTQVRGTVLAVHKQLPDGSWSLPRKRDLRGCISLLDGVQARPQRALPHQALNRVDHEHGPDRKLDQIPVENPVSITGGSRSNPDG
jgi:ketosteroid isomerase-like protein